MRDLRYAVRQLVKSAGFSATVVLTLALGIGASSAIFCLMDGLWLHPVRAPHSGQLVRVFATTGQDSEGLFTYPDFQAFAQRTPAFSGLAAIALLAAFCILLPAVAAAAWVPARRAASIEPMQTLRAE